MFRPHPLYYAFMHRELLAMLSQADKDAYLGPLESGRVRPALITLDDELRALGPRFLSFLRHHYVSADGVFYFPGLAQIPDRRVRFVERKHDPGTLEGSSVFGQVVTCVAMGAQRFLNIASVRREPAPTSLAFDRLGDVAFHPESCSAAKRRQIASAEGGQFIQLPC